MKYLDEFRDRSAVEALADRIRSVSTKPWNIMEVCGGQTHSILRNGLDSLLPEGITLIHGPGCPVCVTPPGLIDMASSVSLRNGAILCTFGDMMRVPGNGGDLQSARASGADIRVVISPLDAVRLARAEPSRQVVFFAVGFETTVPVTATAVLQAAGLGAGNFSVINAHVRVPPAIRAILSRPSCRVEGILAAGHVCSVTGYEEYEPMAEEYSTPIVVTGFEAVDILQGLLMCITQLEAGISSVENQYARVVRRAGNPRALELMAEVFEPVDAAWRGMGIISGGGFAIRGKYSLFDARNRFETSLPGVPREECGTCRAAEVLTGEMAPDLCGEFGSGCTPEHPLGAPMVSTEGACAAYYRYRSTAS